VGGVVATNRNMSVYKILDLAIFHFALPQILANHFDDLLVVVHESAAIIPDERRIPVPRVEGVHDMSWL
jgi:hypothetical protein